MSVATYTPQRGGGRLQLLPLEDCCEFVAAGRLPPSAGGPPARPGQVERDAGGRARLLHFAPGRWLVPAPDAPLRARLATLADAGHGTLVDVGGKWRPVGLKASVAGAVLASALDVDLLLSGREVAAVQLFDCPAILARPGTGFELWVAASYLYAFSQMVDALRIRD